MRQSYPYFAGQNNESVQHRTIAFSTFYNLQFALNVKFYLTPTLYPKKGKSPNFPLVQANNFHEPVDVSIDSLMES